MKKKVKTSSTRLSPPAQGKLITRQVTKVMDRKLLPVMDLLKSVQFQMEQRKLPTAEEHHPIIYKQISLLLLVPSANDFQWEEPLRHLVKEVTVNKYAHPLRASLSEHRIDLIIVIGGAEQLSPHNIEALQLTSVPKVIWLADEKGVTDTDRQLAPLFDYVFTQNENNSAVYQAMSCEQVHVMPFGARSRTYYPRVVGNENYSDILILGRAGMEANPLLEAYMLDAISKGSKVRVSEGSGFALEGAKVVDPTVPIEDYYNGANLVINSSGSMQCWLEVAACGTFQLVQYEPSHPFPKESLDSLLFFYTLEDLTEKVAYYELHVDEKRGMASRALSDQKYNHSFLQKGIQLLDIVFTKLKSRGL
ncbi:spore maturation protein CgeB [Paenibacillus shirakamiensis]|uniref:Spore maturation protein CgeB n=1 Tax=Paenibacillus shirakamiensis TaxID=1265935 RepID=A0ABS4JJX5_9BACL|nr:glycosyltransferase [Paenibacillus shirakamiensis]MBP2002011.1 spore maturation protein CgeB [Paenibacillus shirakamiensis]